MGPFALALIAFVLLLVFRVLNVASQPKPPRIFYKDEKFAAELRQMVPCLEAPYVPTRMWGFSGHIQTVLHSLIGRKKCPWPIGERVAMVCADGSTLTYDVYQPLDVHPSGLDTTLILCPGICNSSESIYIRTFVHHAQRQGYRCVALNHIGAMKSVKVTAHRIFSYNCTSDLHAVVTHSLEAYPHTKAVAVGFSLGANLVAKYLGERRFTVPANIVGGISICQGYDALMCTKYLLSWSNFRRFYLYVMTENMKRLLMAHHQHVLHDDVKSKYQLNERQIMSAAILPEFDEAYTRRLEGFETVEDFYRSSSCCHHLDNISVPIVFINAEDDPLVPDTLHQWPTRFVANHDKSAFILTTHGGHLGYYEGGFIRPNLITWLDRAAVGIADTILSQSSKN